MKMFTICVLTSATALVSLRSATFHFHKCSPRVWWPLAVGEVALKALYKKLILVCLPKVYSVVISARYLLMISLSL